MDRNNSENINNQGMPRHVPIVHARLVQDVEVSITINLAVLGNLHRGEI